MTKTRRLAAIDNLLRLPDYLRCITLLLVALSAGGCTGAPVAEAVDSPAGPESCEGAAFERYTPTGTAVTAAAECPAWPASCPYLCRSPVCEGADGALSCEPCAELDDYNSYDGAAGCRWLRVDEGAFSHACD